MHSECRTLYRIIITIFHKIHNSFHLVLTKLSLGFCLNDPRMLIKLDILKDLLQYLVDRHELEMNLYQVRENDRRAWVGGRFACELRQVIYINLIGLFLPCSSGYSAAYTRHSLPSGFSCQRSLPTQGTHQKTSSGSTLRLICNKRP